MQKIKKFILSITVPAFILMQTTFIPASAAPMVTEVSGFLQLKSAAENASDGDIIVVSGNITFEAGQFLSIDKSITFKSGNAQNVSMISAENMRHIHVTGDVSLSFENVILDGGNKSGGILVLPQANHTVFTNVNIKNCFSQNGGAIEVPAGKTFQLSKGVITGNKAAGKGGGVYIGESCGTEISDTVLTGNEAVSGGGIYAGAGSTVTVKDGKIDSNKAVNGGGIYKSSESKSTLPLFFTVDFDSLGGTAILSQIVKNRSRVIRPGPPQKSGFTFAGWYTDTEYTTEWNFDTDVVTRNRTLYAKWTQEEVPSVILKYDPNGGAGTEYIMPGISANDSVTVLASNDTSLNYTKSGYTFNHWNTQPDDSGTDYLPGSIFTVTGDMTLYAQWTANPPPVLNFTLERAVDTVPAYQAAPNTWKLHGTTGPDLYMADKIIVSTIGTITAAKWAEGTLSEEDFKTAGTSFIYTNGIRPAKDGIYSIYLENSEGLSAVKTIEITGLRDGASQTGKPFLLIDKQTANALSASVPGIEVFTLSYLQGGGTRLTNHYEIYEDIETLGELWTPVAGSFIGTLDGNGHAVKDLTINVSSGSAGLFAQINSTVSTGGKVLNLGIRNANIQGGQRVGAVAGITIGAVITNCYSTGTVSGTGWVGGIAGHVQTGSSSATNSTVISNCFSSAEILATAGTAGGIASDVSNSGVGDNSPIHVIKNCYTTGNVTSLTGHAGGITSYLYGRSNATYPKAPTVQNCYSTGKITGGTSSAYTAGISGYAIEPFLIENCYALNKGVDGGNVARVLGISRTKTFVNNYALNTITLKGVVPSNGTATNLNGADTTPARATDPALNIYKNEGNWDFDDIWTFDYSGYPVAGGTNLPILRVFSNIEQSPHINDSQATGLVQSDSPVQASASDGTSKDTVTVTDTQILNNTAQKNGGGIWIVHLRDLFTDRVDFNHNTAATKAIWDESKESETGVLYKSHIKDTVPSSPFTNAYNNYDIIFAAGINYPETGDTQTNIFMWLFLAGSCLFLTFVLWRGFKKRGRMW